MKREQVLAEIEKAQAATPGPWWDDTYNTAFDGQNRIMFSIPDHPTDDEYYGPDQMAEKDAWYRESAANKDMLISAAGNYLAVLRQLDAAVLLLRFFCEAHTQGFTKSCCCSACELVRPYCED